MRNAVNTTSRENWNKIDEALNDLAQLLGPLLGAVIDDAYQAGLWSANILHPDIQKNIKSPADIEKSGDLSLILGVMLDSWNHLQFDSELAQYGITYQQAYRVRHVRNEFAHSQGNYNDISYVNGCLRAIEVLHQGFLALIASHSAGSPTVAQPSQSSLNFVSRAKAHLDARRFNDAVVDSSKALTINPHDANAYYIRGMAYRRQRDYVHAVIDLDKAIGLVPDNVDAHIEKGWAHIDAGQFDRAIWAFDYGIQRLPAIPSLWNGRGLASEYNGQTQQAFDDYDRATKLDPNYAPAWANLGRLYAEVGQIDSGISHLDWAIGLDPHLAWVWNARGYAYVQKKKYGKAVADFQQSVELDPSFHLAQNNLKVARSLRRKRIIRWSLVGVGLLLIVWSIVAI